MAWAFELMLAEVHRYEGTVNQFFGDGIMTLFGAPIAHEDHARGRCTPRLRDELGLDGIVAELNPGGLLPPALEARSLEILAREVAPALR